VCAAGLWSFVLLGRTSGWQPELRWLVLALTVLTAIGLAVPVRRDRPLRVLLASGLAATVIGTAAFGLATAASPHSGSIPSVGPAAAVAASTAGGGMPSGAGGGGMPTDSGGTRPGGSDGGSASGGSASGSSASGSSAKSGSVPTGTRPSGGTASGSSSPGAAGGMPSGGGATTASAALTKALEATSSKWAAAVVGDQSAAELELSSGKAVISIGGWSGTDNSPTLAQFKQYVATGQVRYLIASGNSGGGPGGSSGVASQIITWVEAHYTKVTIGGQTVYDLSQPSS
jgi:hypothetical protein